ncbi:hypothetical protein [Roseicella aquatilis]|uniref:Uncharacterized protein n=1 Tax=Roseicella aquatilis TaxID=2527868 RepID=A0A4R4DT84_9PROT|nr:hypothetical protein [Roseicella aquatilis]TCZ63201.1 hypothetical protein EXY23_10205 [Roseicella aquatilis]
MTVLGFDTRAFERELAGLRLDGRQAHGVLCVVRSLSTQRQVALREAAIAALLGIRCFAVAALFPLLLPT